MPGVISPATCDEILAIAEQVHAPLVTLAALDAELERTLAPVMRACYVPGNPNAYFDVILNIAIAPLRQQIVGHARGVGLTKLLEASNTPLALAPRGDDWLKNFRKQIKRLVL